MTSVEKTVQKNAQSRLSLKENPTQVVLRIVLVQPPPGIDFGLQKGRGSAYETIQKQLSKGDDLEFEFTVAIKTAKNGAPDFAGSFVQGSSGARFIYVDIGTYAGQANTIWSRRLKVPLSMIDWELIRKAAGATSKTLETRVPGTGKDGGPACASVRPAPIWRPI